jgi:osmoprotectant transport system substrate-binding protein
MKAIFNQKRGMTVIALALLVSLLTSCIAQPSGGSATTGGNKGTITVASKDFTEEFILGEMYALLLENGGYKVTRKINLGGTPVAQQALLNGEIDLYPEYTGTGLLTVLKLPVMNDPKAVYDKVKAEYESQFKLTWLEPAPMNNTQALAMTKPRAQALAIIKISDMVAKADQLIMAGPPEFAEREDGIPGLKKVYGDFALKSFLPIDPGLRYQALTSGQADVVVAFGTDGEIAANDLLVLQDDKGLYPPYQVAPVIRLAVLNQHQDIADILNKLAPLLTNETMQRLNNEVSGKKREPADVAKEFLISQKLIKG